MNYCEVRKSPKGQTLKEMSGLDEFSAISAIKGFVNLYNRYPELDEIPYANSEPYLRKQLGIKSVGDTNYIKLDKLSEIADTPEEAVIHLNNEYRDLEIEIIPIGNSGIINIKHRPTEYVDEAPLPKEVRFTDSREANTVILLDALDRLKKFYGIDIIPINKSNFQEVPQASAFIYNGNIFVNTDIASIDSPVHELLHLFLGSIRFNNPSLYFSLVQTVEQLPNFLLLATNYPNRTRGDVQEEVFVEELGKYLTGQQSMMDNVSPDIMNVILYNIKRDIDSIVFGQISVKSLSLIYNQSLLQLAERLHSENFDVDTAASIDDAMIHRIMANTKEELLESNELLEECS